MKILGISLGHDTNFSLVQDGQVIAVIEAERFFRQKRYKLHCLTLTKGKQRNGFQYTDIDELISFLESIGNDWGQSFDVIAVQNQGRVGEFDNLRTLLGSMGFTAKQYAHLNHHLCHAALAFYTSPFPDALILSYDGMGNDGQTVLFRGDARGLVYLERNGTSFGHAYNNLGFILGVKPDVSGSTAGKVMGLTAYGKENASWRGAASKYVRRYTKFPSMPGPELNSYGSGHRINSVGLIDIPELREFIVPGKRTPDESTWRFRLRDAFRSTDRREIRLPGPESPLAQDLAKTVQASWTVAVLEMLARFRNVSSNICIVGGCALNGVTNFSLQQTGWFGETHFVPNPSDCGLATGAALYANFSSTPGAFSGNRATFSPYLGSEPFDRHEIYRVRDGFGYREIPLGIIDEVIAELIARDRLVAVIRGRYEIGPRALGNRSILCNPLNPTMRETLNEKVKHREWYRPFAPVVTAQDSGKYFTNTADIPYMSVICHTRPEFSRLLPSVTHVDGSARVQTVREDQNPALYRTLRAFERRTGVPILLNTSLNPRGEPILNFVGVALEMLNATSLDVVVDGTALYCRKGRESILDEALDRVKAGDERS